MRLFRHSALQLLIVLISIWNCALGQNREMTVCAVPAITDYRILPETDIRMRCSGTSVRIRAAKGEYESASIVVSAGANPVTVTISIMELLGVNESFPSSEIDIKAVKVWYQGCDDTKTLQYTHCPGGPKRVLVPELLLHDSQLIRVDRKTQTNWLRIRKGSTSEYIDISQQGPDYRKYSPTAGHLTDKTLPPDIEFDDRDTLQPVRIEARENQQFWVTVRVPDTLGSGIYSGTILISSDRGTVLKLPLQIEVLPFELEKPMLEYSLYYRGRIFEKTPERVSSELKTERQFRAEMLNMAQHGISSCTVTQAFNPERRDFFEKTLQIMKDTGLGGTLYMLWAGEYYDKPEKTRRLLNHARKMGYHQVYFYGGDELSPSQANERRESWKQMQSWNGKIFSAVEKAAYSLPDILDLAIVDRIRDPGLAKAYHAQGRRIFSYGIPQVGIELPETYRRSYGLPLWKVGYDGTMGYAYQHGWSSIWNDFDGYTRDHVFAYPTTNGVIDTIQWEGFREAVDDVRYLSTLIKMVELAKRTGLSPGDSEAWVDRIDTSGDLDLIRKSIIERILMLQKIIDSQSKLTPSKQLIQK